MGDYYLYLLDRIGRISARIDLCGCTDDDHARAVAGANDHHGGMELWQGNRRVHAFGDLISRTAEREDR